LYGIHLKVGVVVGLNSCVPSKGSTVIATFPTPHGRQQTRSSKVLEAGCDFREQERKGSGGAFPRIRSLSLRRKVSSYKDGRVSIRNKHSIGKKEALTCLCLFYSVLTFICYSNLISMSKEAAGRAGKSLRLMVRAIRFPMIMVTVKIIDYCEKEVAQYSFHLNWSRFATGPALQCAFGRQRVL
jgi:hypothetical protein